MHNIANRNNTSTITVPYDSYISVSIVHKNGFKYDTPSRGYKLKSCLAFHNKLHLTESITYAEITAEQHQLLTFGPMEPVKKTRTKTVKIVPVVVPVVPVVVVKKPVVKKPVVKKPVVKKPVVKKPVVKKPK